MTGFSDSEEFYDLFQTFVDLGGERNSSSIAFTFLVVTSERFALRHFADQRVSLSERCSDSLPALLHMCVCRHGKINLIFSQGEGQRDL